MAISTVFATLLAALSLRCSTASNGLPSASALRPKQQLSKHPWPLEFDDVKCAHHNLAKAAASETVCQARAEANGHPYFQYNSAQKLCITVPVCTRTFPARLWQVFSQDSGLDDGEFDYDHKDGEFGKDGDEHNADDEDEDARESPIIVQLSTQSVPVYRNEMVVAQKSAYFGTIEVGMGAEPQLFNVVFDTGSGHLLLPSHKCSTEACLAHNRYNETLSNSAVHIDHDGIVVQPTGEKRDEVEIQFGTGEVAGEFAYETVCLGQADPTKSWPPTDGPMKVSPRSLTGSRPALGRGCTRLRVVLATAMTRDPFLNFKFDGVLGLGLRGLALNPEFSFFHMLTSQLRAPQPIFGVYISSDESTSSEIAFGGVDPQRFSDEMQWASVVKPHLGYWQVAIKAIRIAGQNLTFCEDGGCVGILDTGTSLIGAPDAAVREMHPRLVREVPGNPTELDCAEIPGPDMVIDLGGFEVSLTYAEYSRPKALRVTGGQQTRTLCRASLLRSDIGEPIGPKAFILGEPLLRRYYTAYNSGSHKVGFALATPAPRPDVRVAAPESPQPISSAELPQSVIDRVESQRRNVLSAASPPEIIMQ